MRTIKKPIFIISLLVVVGLLFLIIYKKFENQPDSPTLFEVGVGSVSTEISDFAVREITGDQYKKQTVRFTNGMQLVDFGYFVSYIGALWYEGKFAMLLLGRNDCAECEPTRSLVVYSLNRGMEMEFIYPGKQWLVDPSQNPVKERVVSSVRAFFGNCMPNFDTHLLWISDKANNAKIVFLNSEGTIEQVEVSYQAAINSVKNLASHQCTEIPGEDQSQYK